MSFAKDYYFLFLELLELQQFYCLCASGKGVLRFFIIIILLSSYSDALIHCAHCILHSSKEALKQQDSVSF